MNPNEESRVISILLFDGECAFCNWAVRFVLEHEKTDTLRFASLSSPLARRLVDSHPALQDVDSVIWMELDEVAAPTRYAIKSSAALRIARYLGGWWSVLWIAWLVPKPLRDGLYDLLARNRRRILVTSQRPLKSLDSLTSSRFLQ